MAHLNIAEADFASEISVIREERRQRTEDQPTGVLFEQLYAAAITANPARQPVIGWMADPSACAPTICASGVNAGTRRTTPPWWWWAMLIQGGVSAGRAALWPHPGAHPAGARGVARAQPIRRAPADAETARPAKLWALARRRRA